MRLNAVCGAGEIRGQESEVRSQKKGGMDTALRGHASDYLLDQELVEGWNGHGFAWPCMHVKQLQVDIPDIQAAIYSVALSLDAFLMNGIQYGVLQEDIFLGMLQKTSNNLL